MSDFFKGLLDTELISSGTTIDCSHGPITLDSFMRSCHQYGIEPKRAADMAASMFTREAVEQYMIEVAVRFEAAKQRLTLMCTVRDEVRQELLARERPND
jgi:hypothetical protein